MKRIVLFLIVVLLTATSVFAQEAVQDSAYHARQTEQNYGRRILINKFSDNWDISARVGTQAYWGEYVHSYPYFKFQDWWTLPAVDVSFSKWGTNSIGLSVGATFSPFKSLYMKSERHYASFATENDPRYRPDLIPEEFYVAKGWMGNVYFQFVFDLCNLFGGYKSDRIYSLVAHLGGGIVVPLSQTIYKDVCASFNAGLVNKFRLTKHLFLDIAIRGTLHDDMFNGISYYTSDDIKNLSVDATIGATVGLSYRFNFRKSTTISTKGKRMNEEGWRSVDQVVPYTAAYQQVEKELEVANTKLEELKESGVVPSDPSGESYRQLEKELAQANDSIANVMAALNEANNQLAELKANQREKEAKETKKNSDEPVGPTVESYQQLEKELAKANDSIANMSAALADANSKLQKTSQNKETEVVITEPVKFRHLVNFVIDRWELSNREKVGIMFAADFIKEHPTRKFLVKGYADMQTATPPHNVMLSRNRAEVVYNCLVKEFGVNPDQLEKSHYGGVDYMYYNDEQCSRSVLILSIDNE